MITNEMSMRRAPDKVLNWVLHFNGFGFTLITARYEIRLVVNRVDYQLTTQVLELAKHKILDDT